MKKILILSFSKIQSDPRVMRQIRLLEQVCDLTVAGYGEKPDANIRFVEVVKPRTGIVRKVWWALKLLAGAFESYYWGQHHVRSAERLLKSVDVDLIVANDLSALPLALRLAGSRPVLYDAHEYSPRELEDQFVWRLLFGRYNHVFCKRYLPQVAGMLTICQGIADEYARNYGVKPKVVHNAPVNQHLIPSPVQDGRIRMIHHGVASRVRHLETMVEMMGHLDDRFTLDLMLMEVEPDYMHSLRQKAGQDSRIRFIKPVPMPQICQSINRYDIGLYLLPPNNFNQRHALPNKFFEFVQARLAVAIGPSPEMATLVQRHGCGVVAESFEPHALARALQGLTAENVAAYKDASHRAAEELSFTRGGAVILSEIARLAK